MKDRENTDAGRGPSQLPEDIIRLMKIVIVCGNQFNHKYFLLDSYIFICFFHIDLCKVKKGKVRLESNNYTPPFTSSHVWYQFFILLGTSFTV